MTAYDNMKQIQVVDYLQSIGLKPVKIENDSAWFLSPFRNEAAASFKVNMVKNVWIDHAEGKGGNLISLVMRLNNATVSQAYKIIEQKADSIFSFQNQFNVNDTGDTKIEIFMVKPLLNDALIEYISYRGIELRFAYKFLQEAYYKVNGKKYFALAFKNDLGGYELRNKIWKGGNSPKYFTTIPGSDHSQVNVFEGFMDFLSACTLSDHLPHFDSLVLNGLGQMEKADRFIQKARKINLYLDNDSAGRQAVIRIIEKYNNVLDISRSLYPDHKDLNDMLMDKMKKLAFNKRD